MIELFDTHTHFEGSPEENAAAAERARQAGVTKFMAIGGSEKLNATANEFPIRALGWDRDQYASSRSEIDYTGVAAVGEIGLDYYYDPDHRQEQLKLFSSQLELAKCWNKPVVIHTRYADDDTLGVLREIPSRGIIHCFTGSTQFCRALMDLGFMISISGIVTFRAADNVRESALVIPDDRLLIETDSPFLAPVPKRGKVNEPAFLVHTARFLAELRKIPFERLAELTFQNAERTLCIDC